MRHFYLSLSLLFLLSSCTPLRVVRLAPAVESTEYDYGQPVLRQNTTDAEVTVSYYDATPNYLVFNLMVENKGDANFNFDPASCLLVPDVGPVTAAINPEVQLLSMDMDEMKRSRTQRTLAWVGAGLLVAGVAADVAGDGLLGNGAEGVANNVSFAEELAFSTVDAVVFTVANTTTANSRVANALPADQVPIPESRIFWLDHSLRITTVRPGEIAFGKVVFPRNDQATNFSFQVDVNDRKLKFPYDQQVFR